MLNTVNYSFIQKVNEKEVNFKTGGMKREQLSVFYNSSLIHS